MADEPRFDARLAEGVAYFEEMLRLMPEDRTTLEFLVVAYEQLGRAEDSQKALVSLARILIRERDVQALEGLLPRLEKSENADAKALALKIRTLTAPAPDLTPEVPREMTEGERTALVTRLAVKSELALVEALAGSGVLSAEQAKEVSASLGASPTDGRVFLVSALQILEKENMALAEKCAAHLADVCGTPPVPLEAFDPPRELAARFPELTMRVRGAVPFAALGRLALVALLNPSDEGLRQEFESVMPCRFYLADPSAVEKALGRLFAKEEAEG